jgi:FkbM family methyltransferase
LRFSEYCRGKDKEIIAFEPNPDQYHVCVRNAEKVIRSKVFPYALYNENTTVHFSTRNLATGAISTDSAIGLSIEAKRLDDVLAGQKPTFVKMDIEGAELAALEGAAKTIQECKPKLAVCVYHKPQDIWEIPGFILSLRSDYRLYLRHYSTAMGETVLYAV